MKKLLVLSMTFLLSACYTEAQDKIIGEKGSTGVIGEKSQVGIIGEEGTTDAAIAKSNARIEIAFAEYKQQYEEMEKSLADLRLRIEEGVKLLETHKRFRSPKHGIRLRTSWKDAMKQLAEAEKKVNVVKAGVVAPDMIR